MPDAAADELVRKIEALHARLADCERVAAASSGRVSEAESSRSASLAERNRVVEQREAQQAACRATRELTKTMAEEHEQLATEAAEKRAQLSAQFSKAMDDLEERCEAEAEERKKVGEDNVVSAERLEKYKKQGAASLAHRETEIRAKDLEQKLGAARLAETDAHMQHALEKLTRAQMQVDVGAAREASQRDHLELCATRWAEIEQTVGRTQAALGEYDAQLEAAAAAAAEHRTARDRHLRKLEAAEKKRVALQEEVADLETRIEASKASKARLAEESRELQKRRAAAAARSAEAEPEPEPQQPPVEAA